MEDIEMSELKPCPFCGQDVRLYEHEYYGDVWKSFWCIACDNKDGCLGSPDYCADTKEEIVTMWNRRAVG